MKCLTLIEMSNFDEHFKHCLNKLNIASLPLPTPPALCLLQKSRIGFVFRRIRQDLIFVVIGCAPNVEFPIGNEHIGHRRRPEISHPVGFCEKRARSSISAKAEPALCLLQKSRIGPVFRRIRQDLSFLVSGGAQCVHFV